MGYSRVPVRDGDSIVRIILVKVNLPTHTNTHTHTHTIHIHIHIYVRAFSLHLSAPQNLILLNHHDATPVRTLLDEGVSRQPFFIDENVTLDKMLNEFQKVVIKLFSAAALFSLP